MGCRGVHFREASLRMQEWIFVEYVAQIEALKTSTPQIASGRSCIITHTEIVWSDRDGFPDIMTQYSVFAWYCVINTDRSHYRVSYLMSSVEGHRNEYEYGCQKDRESRRIPTGGGVECHVHYDIAPTDKH
jgi:hypothetical protein